MNERVIDLGEPYAAFMAAQDGKSVRANLGHAIRAGQKLAYDQVSFADADEDALRSVAAEIACVSVANAALFVRPLRAKGPQDVGVRLAETPLTTLAFLLQQQLVHGPSLARANVTVWRLATRPAA